MNKHNQNGSVHVVIVSIMALVILCLVGYVFWSNFLQPKSEEKAVSTTTSLQTPSPSPSVAVKPETLALTSWGVQFTVTDELKKAGVQVEKQTTPQYPSGTYTDYYITTSRQRAFGQLTEQNVNKLCDAGSGVTVRQVVSATPGDGDTTQQINAKPIAGFYYRWGIPSAGGCDGPDTKAIVAALKSLESVQ
jgi:hypothetical protein